MVTTTSRLAELVLEEQSKLSEEYQKAKGTPDIQEMIAAINGIQTRATEAGKVRFDTEVAEANKLAESESKARLAFTANALDVLSVAFKPLAVIAGKLLTVDRVVFEVARDSDKVFTQFAILTPGKNQKATGAGKGGNRNHKITVDEKEYGSVTQAWKGLMGSVAQPSKDIGGTQVKSRDVAVAAFTAAGHKVS